MALAGLFYPIRWVELATFARGAMRSTLAGYSPGLLSCLVFIMSKIPRWSWSRLTPEKEPRYRRHTKVKPWGYLPFQRFEASPYLPLPCGSVGPLPHVRLARNGARLQPGALVVTGTTTRIGAVEG